MHIGFLSLKDPLEEEMATHPRILAWRIPWIEEPSGLQSIALQRVGHDWITNTRSAVGLSTFKLQYSLYCSFSLFLENWLSLPTIGALLPVITPLSLCIQRILAFLVLCHSVQLALATLCTESLAGFRNIHHLCKSTVGIERSFLMSCFFPEPVITCNLYIFLMWL